MFLFLDPVSNFYFFFFTLFFFLDFFFSNTFIMFLLCASNCISPLHDAVHKRSFNYSIIVLLFKATRTLNDKVLQSLITTTRKTMLVGGEMCVLTDIFSKDSASIYSRLFLCSDTGKRFSSFEESILVMCTSLLCTDGYAAGNLSYTHRRHRPQPLPLISLTCYYYRPLWYCSSV